MTLNSRLGRYIVTAYGDETVRAYVPPPLPPDPPLRLEGLQRLLEQANRSLGRLDGLATALPNLSIFIYAYVRKYPAGKRGVRSTTAWTCPGLHGCARTFPSRRAH